MVALQGQQGQLCRPLPQDLLLKEKKKELKREKRGMKKFGLGGQRSSRSGGYGDGGDEKGDEPDEEEAEGQPAMLVAGSQVAILASSGLQWANDRETMGAAVEVSTDQQHYLQGVAAEVKGPSSRLMYGSLGSRFQMLMFCVLVLCSYRDFLLSLGTRHPPPLPVLPSKLIPPGCTQVLT